MSVKYIHNKQTEQKKRNEIRNKKRNGNNIYINICYERPIKAALCIQNERKWNERFNKSRN